MLRHELKDSAVRAEGSCSRHEELFQAMAAAPYQLSEAELRLGREARAYWIDELALGDGYRRGAHT